MKKARWLLESFTSDELNELKKELKSLLVQCDENSFLLLRELLEKIQINLHSRSLRKEGIAWRCWVRKEQASQRHWEKEQGVG